MSMIDELELYGNTEKFNCSGSKYLRKINLIKINDSNIDASEVFESFRVDVYAVLEAFEVTCPARQHAIKKLLCAGLRGKGDIIQDLGEAADAVRRAIQIQKARTEGKR